VLAIHLEAQGLKTEDNELHAEGAMTRAQNTQRMEIENINKNTEEYLETQYSGLATTKSVMKGNKVHRQQAVTQFQETYDEKLKEVL